MVQPVAIGLFAGLGGWAEGLLAAGYYVVGFDIEQHVYGDQRYPAQLVVQDVLTLHGSQFKDAALIVASPPCQEYSYMAMPWTLAKAKAAAIRADHTGQKLADLNRLFEACFRIQREACEAAGHHIPMVVENVRGAIPWVGRSRWNFGSFHLWGDVPALMPTTGATKNNGGSWFAVGGPGQLITGQNPDGRKTPSHLKPPARVSVEAPAEGSKGAGAGAKWFDQNTSSLPSGSIRRKMASAMIAKIPLALSRHIAEVYKP